MVHAEDAVGAGAPAPAQRAPRGGQRTPRTPRAPITPRTPGGLKPPTHVASQQERVEAALRGMVDARIAQKSFLEALDPSPEAASALPPAAQRAAADLLRGWELAVSNAERAALELLGGDGARRGDPGPEAEARADAERLQRAEAAFAAARQEAFHDRRSSAQSARSNLGAVSGRRRRRSSKRRAKRERDAAEALRLSQGEASLADSLAAGGGGGAGASAGPAAVDGLKARARLLRSQLRREKQAIEQLEQRRAKLWRRVGHLEAVQGSALPFISAKAKGEKPPAADGPPDRPRAAAAVPEISSASPPGGSAPAPSRRPPPLSAPPPPRLSPQRPSRPRSAASRGRTPPAPARDGRVDAHEGLLASLQRQLADLRDIQTAQRRDIAQLRLQARAAAALSAAQAREAELRAAERLAEAGAGQRAAIAALRADVERLSAVAAAARGAAGAGAVAGSGSAGGPPSPPKRMSVLISSIVEGLAPEAGSPKAAGGESLAQQVQAAQQARRQAAESLRKLKAKERRQSTVIKRGLRIEQLYHQQSTLQRDRPSPRAPPPPAEGAVAGPLATDEAVAAAAAAALEETRGRQPTRRSLDALTASRPSAALPHLGGAPAEHAPENGWRRAELAAAPGGRLGVALAERVELEAARAMREMLRERGGAGGGNPLLRVPRSRYRAAVACGVCGGGKGVAVGAVVAEVNGEDVGRCSALEVAIRLRGLQGEGRRVVLLAPPADAAEGYGRLIEAGAVQRHRMHLCDGRSGKQLWMALRAVVRGGKGRLGALVEGAEEEAAAGADARIFELLDDSSAGTESEPMPQAKGGAGAVPADGWEEEAAAEGGAEGQGGGETDAEEDGADGPVEGAKEPVEGAKEALEGAEEPLEGAKAPLEGAEVPSEAAEEALEAADEPLEAAEEALEAADEPLEAIKEPSDAAEEPSRGAEEPSAAQEPSEDAEGASSAAAAAGEGERGQGGAAAQPEPQPAAEEGAGAESGGGGAGGAGGGRAEALGELKALPSFDARISEMRPSMDIQKLLFDDAEQMQDLRERRRGSMLSVYSEGSDDASDLLERAAAIGRR